MTGFWGVTKWGQTRDKRSRDVTKFWVHARNRTTTRFVRVWILSHFCPRCDKFCHNSLIHQVFVTYLTEMVFLLWQILSPVCHILYVLWQILSNFYPRFVTCLSPVCHILQVLWQNLSNFCPQFVTSYKCYDKFCLIFVPGLSHFLDFYTFFMHKMHILAFCPIFVTFFVTWDKFCHFFNTLETQ